MPSQTVRQQARRVALDAQTRMRQQRAEQDHRRSALAVTVVTALAQRDALVRSCEARAGAALRALIDDEGLTIAEAVQWCGGVEQLTVKEATRLRKATADATAKPEAPATAAEPTAAR
jgi:selenophosphate synthetase-related protein